MTQTQGAEVLQLFPDDDLVVPQPRKPRKPDVIWDALEQIFGPVPYGTRAHGKRNLAVKDLRLMEATPDEVCRAKAEFHKAFPACRCTDMALAMHFPLLRPKKISPPCQECGVGGGYHAADCVKVGGR